MSIRITQKKVLTMILLSILIANTIASTSVIVYAAISIQLNTSTLDQGDTLQITVTGGTANDAVMLQINNPWSSTIWADQDTFDSGRGYTYQIKIPSSWSFANNYDIIIKDVYTNTTATKTFSIQEPPPPSSPPSRPSPPPPPTNKNPVAIATVIDPKALVDQVIIFNGENSYDTDGIIELYLWIFGDEDTSTDGVETHTYDEPGSYNASLTVVDNNGATGSTWVIITITEPPIPPSQSQETSVPANSTDYFVDATDTAEATLNISTTKPVTLTIVKYPENPHPEATLPDNALPKFIDIFVGNPDAVIWPIYTEVGYSHDDIIGLDENELALYYYKDGAWHKSRETGVYPEENIVWANLYQDELTGSPLVIVGTLLPSPAEFQLSNLEISSEEVYPLEEVTVTFDISNIGETTGNYTAILKINEEIENTWNLTIGAGEIQTLSHTLSRNAPGTYTVQADILASIFEVLTSAEFEYLLSAPSPIEVESGENVTINVKVSNVGTGPGRYAFNLELDGETINTDAGELLEGRSEIISYTVSSQTAGAHTINIFDQQKSFVVLHPAEFIYTIISIFPETVDPGEEVQVDIRIENVGGATGSFEVNVALDGQLVDRYLGELFGGESTLLFSEITSDIDGIHSIEINGETALFIVEEEPSEPSGSQWIQINMVLLAIVLAISIIIYYLDKTGRISL